MLRLLHRVVKTLAPEQHYMVLDVSNFEVGTLAELGVDVGLDQELLGGCLLVLAAVPALHILRPITRHAVDAIHLQRSTTASFRWHITKIK